jgi:hypothetical protein
VLDLKRATMSAHIIPLSRAENVETPAPLCPPLDAPLPAWLTGALRRYWHRARLSVEVLGWIVVAASIYAVAKG